MLPDLNNLRDLLLSLIKAKSSGENPVEHITNGFLVFSVKSNRL